MILRLCWFAKLTHSLTLGCLPATQKFVDPYSLFFVSSRLVSAVELSRHAYVKTTIIVQALERHVKLIIVLHMIDWALGALMSWLHALK